DTLYNAVLTYPDFRDNKLKLKTALTKAFYKNITFTNLNIKHNQPLKIASLALKVKVIGIEEEEESNELSSESTEDAEDENNHNEYCEHYESKERDYVNVWN
ncbi:9909_t:CDS:2, partial [Racocetra fulgida]